MNKRWIIVFDWETDGKDPNTCNPVELAAIPINPRTLEICEKPSFWAFSLVLRAISFTRFRVNVIVMPNNKGNIATR